LKNINEEMPKIDVEAKQTGDMVRALQNGAKIREIVEECRDKNGKLDPRSLSPASHTSVWWKCAQGHSYKSAPYSRTGRYNSGCPFCTGRKALPGFNDLKTLKPELASEWYQPFNGDLTPEDVTLSSNKKVWWCCSENHVWEACVYSRTRYRGSGCPVCAGVAKSCKVGYFIDKAYPV
ncbi:MAG: zinc-ribbon domain-containing protein, partial [Clostridia bacterium]|nr:zinc-ribbon domain-containing protein [Clostridia bacterium]